MKTHYEEDDATFIAPAYTVKAYRGIAWYVLGWELESNEDTEWTGEDVRTGRVVAVMIGDDRHFSFEQSEITPLERESYCGVCGQIGCAHDTVAREL